MMFAAVDHDNWTYPESVREYFHGALQGKEPRKCCVHVVQYWLVRICLVVVLTDGMVKDT